jgi:hypothetical protein
MTMRELDDSTLQMIASAYAIAFGEIVSVETIRKNVVDLLPETAVLGDVRVWVQGNGISIAAYIGGGQWLSRWNGRNIIVSGKEDG